MGSRRLIDRALYTPGSLDRSDAAMPSQGMTGNVLSNMRNNFMADEPYSRVFHLPILVPHDVQNKASGVNTSPHALHLKVAC